MRRLTLALASLLVLLACAGPAAAPAATAAPSPATAAGPRSAPPAATWLRGPSGGPAFLIGASYQGPARRAWRGDYWAWWADDLFRREEVAADFDRAAGAGLNALRIFVQLELLRDIREDRWAKLDTVVELARERGIGLIVVFADYEEPRVERLARVAASVAARYVGNPAILAYELKNEPDFWTIQAARYPDNARPPLQSRRVVEALGERAARHYTDAFRASDEGKKGPLAIPEWFSDEEAYYWHNNWLLSYAAAQDATAWAAATGRADVEYYATPEAARWEPLLRALDETYRAWLEPQLRAIRAADPHTPITVGHHDALIASLPANRLLDAIAWHAYPPAGPVGHEAYVRGLGALRALYPDKPVLLGEFGYRATDRDERAVGVDEAAILLRLYAEGYAGGLKWLLTDTRQGTDSMGAFRMDGSARPLTEATRALALVARALPSAATTLAVGRDGADGLCYTFRAEGAAFSGGSCGDEGSVGVRAHGPAQAFAVAADGVVSITATEAARVVLGLAHFDLGDGRGAPTLERPEGTSHQLAPGDGQRVEFDVAPGGVYRVRR